jgi:hypothetical protein
MTTDFTWQTPTWRNSKKRAQALRLAGTAGPLDTLWSVIPPD